MQLWLYLDGSGQRGATLQDKIIELARAAREATCPDQFWTLSVNALSELGVSGIGYGIVPFSIDAKINGFGSAGLFKNTYPSQWGGALGENAVIEDMTVELIVGGVGEVDWMDDRLDDQSTASQRQQAELEADLGMRFGVSLSLGENVQGQAISGIGLWINDVSTTDGFSRYWQGNHHYIKEVCHIMDCGLRGVHADFLSPLADLEKECLTYLAIGLRPAEICWKLKISEKQLEKKILSSKLKLQARTRDHLVAKALVLNLIRP